MHYIRERVLALGALINKGLDRGDPVIDAPVAIIDETGVVRHLKAGEDYFPAPKSVSPTRADVVQASETLNDIRKSADEAIARIDAWLAANPTAPEVK